MENSMEPVYLEKENISPIYESAEKLKVQYENIDDLVLAAAKYIRDNTREGGVKPKTILESRLTTAEEAFEKKMYSCGTITTMASAMLRHVGFQVKLIHGECKESVDHAWIKVLNPETNEWKEYDITRNGGKVPETNIKKMEVDSWEDIKDQLILDHETTSQRREQRSSL